MIDLLKLEISNLFNFKSLSKVKLISYSILFVYILIACISSICVYTYLGVNYLKQYNLQGYILPIVYLILSIGIFTTNLYKVRSYLFVNNDILFSLPIPITKIFISRVLWIYLINLVFTVLIFIPCLITYVVMLNISLKIYLLLIPLLFFIPVLPTVFSCIFGFLIGYFTSKSKHKNLFEIIFTFFVVFSFMLVSSNMQTILSKFTNNINEISDFLNKFLFFIGYIIKVVNDYDIISLLRFIGFNVAIFIIFILLFKKLFLNIVRNFSILRINKKYVYKQYNNKKELLVLLLNDIKLYLSIPIYVFNTSFGVILALFAAISTIFFDKLIIETMFKEFSFSFYGTIVVLISFCISTCNTTGSSISVEGKHFYLLKSLPIKISNIFTSKILTNVVLFLPFILISVTIFSIVFKFTIIQYILLVLLSILINFNSSIFGLLINLKFPRFEYISYTQIVKQSISATVSIIIPMLIVILTSYLFTLTNISENLYYLYVSIFYIITFLIQLFLLKTYGIKRFKEIN